MFQNYPRVQQRDVIYKYSIAHMLILFFTVQYQGKTILSGTLYNC